MSDGNGLPKGWVHCTLGDVLRIIRGVSYNKSQAYSTGSSDRVPILRATNIDKNLDFNDLVFVPQSCVNDDQLLRQGDIVIAASSGSRNVVGKAAQLRCSWSGSFGAFCMGLRITSEIAPAFVAWFLQSHEYRHRISDLAAGSNINNLRRDHIETFPFRIAPLNEQRRVAAKIEELFSDLDAGTAALERVKAKLKRYRAAVLKAAVEGKLTEEWRKKNQPKETGQQLLGRILQERRRKWEEEQLANYEKAGKKPPEGWKGKYREPIRPDESNLAELPEGWCWATLDQVNLAERPMSYGVLQPGQTWTAGCRW